MEIRTFVGQAATPYFDRVAALRIAVFRDWPYRYDGDAEYEAIYLDTYAKSPRSVFVLAFDGERVVGASTAIPLVDETASFQAPFLQRGVDLSSVFYFGESVLLDAYRGQGIGHRFFDAREGKARDFGGFSTTAFCAVERDPNDPLRPPATRTNDVFWRKRGYVRQHGMTCQLAWPEIGDATPPTHRLCFWLRPLEPAR